MVDQVPPHVGRVQPRLDPDGPEVRGRPDAREHEQLRGVVGARAQDHFALGPRRLAPPAAVVLDPNRAVALEQDPAGLRAGDHVEVVALLAHRVQERVGRAPAPPALLGHLDDARALLLGAVEVVGGGHAELSGGGDEAVGQARDPDRVDDAERPGAVVVRRAQAAVALRPLEVRQDLGIGPARGAALAGPGVEDRAVPAHVDHRVHRARAAQRAPAGQEDRAPDQRRLGLGDVLPVQVGAELLGEPDRDADVELAVRAARLEQQHAVRRVLAQAVGQRAPGRPGSDDHVAVAGHRCRRPYQGRVARVRRWP